MKDIKNNVKIGIKNVNNSVNKNKDYLNNQDPFKDISKMNRED